MSAELTIQGQVIIMAWVYFFWSHHVIDMQAKWEIDENRSLWSQIRRMLHSTVLRARFWNLLRWLKGEGQEEMGGGREEGKVMNGVREWEKSSVNIYRSMKQIWNTFLDITGTSRLFFAKHRFSYFIIHNVFFTLIRKCRMLHTMLEELLVVNEQV